ncbi:sensor domain-containing protein [Parasalinivibrio latis]|uniref:sensor domain-containing protein n=1 Tax=Parasalinivibrio latis TaxID=2952610 RepID=UPI003DA596B2
MSFPLLADIFHSIPIMIAVLDKDLRYIVVSQRYLEYIGKHGYEVLNHSVEDALPSKVYHLAYPNLKRALNGEHISYEVELPSDGDEKRFMNIQYHPRFSPNGKQIGVLMSGLEITGLKKTEAEKAQIQDYLQTVFNEIGHGIAIVNESEKLLLNNPLFLELVKQERGNVETLLPVYNFRLVDVLLELGWQLCHENMFDETFGLNTVHDVHQLITKNNRYLSVRIKNVQGGGLCYTFTDVTEQLQDKRKLIHLATHDSLTQLPNRLLLNDRIEQVIALALRERTTCAMIFVDLDLFKAVNDTFGHQTGDDLLIEVSERLKGISRKTDTVARFAGDEFMLVCGGFRNKESVIRHADRVQKELSKGYVINDTSIKLSVSIGVVLAPEDGTESGELIRKADTALYASKSMGRNRISFFNPEMEISTRQHMLISNSLSEAMENNEISVVYQPVFNASGKVSGVESLARWHNSTLGHVSPEEFIGIAETTNQISELGEYLIRKTFSELKHCVAQTGKSLCVAINVSPLQLNNDNFPSKLLEICVENGFSPGNVEIEITEQMILCNMKNVPEAIRELTQAGFKLAIDDFGTGYSSMTHLREYPFDTVKIDKSFFLASEDIKQKAMVKVICFMAEQLGLKVVAEGIETESDSVFALQSGCDYLQGYLMARPMPLDDLIVFLDGK